MPDSYNTHTKSKIENEHPEIDPAVDTALTEQSTSDQEHEGEAHDAEEETHEEAHHAGDEAHGETHEEDSLSTTHPHLHNHRPSDSKKRRSSDSTSESSGKSKKSKKSRDTDDLKDEHHLASSTTNTTSTPTSTSTSNNNNNNNNDEDEDEQENPIITITSTATAAQAVKAAQDAEYTPRGEEGDEAGEGAEDSGDKKKKNGGRGQSSKDKSKKSRIAAIVGALDDDAMEDIKLQQRRESHKEVERRRRENINTAINKLNELVTASIEKNSGVSSSVSSGNNMFGDDEDSKDNKKDGKKGTQAANPKAKILLRACKYIESLHKELEDLRGKSNLTKLLDEQELTRLSSENENLKNALEDAYKKLKKAGIEED
ncbi:hypothetical protein ACO0QE_003273 [Hanseniaspora vineae]